MDAQDEEATILEKEWDYFMSKLATRLIIYCVLPVVDGKSRLVKHGVHVNYWAKNNSDYPHIAVLAHVSLGAMLSEVGSERDFSLLKLFTNALR